MRQPRLWTHFIAGAIVCVVGATIRLDPAPLIVMGGLAALLVLGWLVYWWRSRWE
ncbi:MAG TPA: hypothetical protein VFG04_11795 [Planctomycetaceae bacterium]|nr:hypothetical protein [Planctomycetaceae bacterium]